MPKHANPRATGAIKRATNKLPNPHQSPHVPGFTLGGEGGGVGVYFDWCIIPRIRSTCSIFELQWMQRHQDQIILQFVFLNLARTSLIKFFCFPYIVQSVSVENYKNRDKSRKRTKFGIHVLEGI